MAKPIRRPRDLSQRALSVVQQATGQTPKLPHFSKNASAVALGRLGGIKGGKRRAALLSAKKRRLIATRAAQTRWQT